MYKIIVTDTAQKDMMQAVTYISEELHNPTAAVKMLDEIEQCYQRLSDMPEMYSFCTQTSLAKKGYRKAVIGHYLLLHRVDRKRKCVYIMHFPYGKQNLLEII